ncbi:hypothetical protein B0H13DRAFT_2379652 [Mycena leptocephala]|nr:hypothetical protein B0H13DRAFT_2379652 [Mycena leptocephala]
MPPRQVARISGHQHRAIGVVECAMRRQKRSVTVAALSLLWTGLTYLPSSANSTHGHFTRLSYWQSTSWTHTPRAVLSRTRPSSALAMIPSVGVNYTDGSIRCHVTPSAPPSTYASAALSSVRHLDDKRRASWDGHSRTQCHWYAIVICGCDAGGG